jgi:hypothetical protein
MDSSMAQTPYGAPEPPKTPYGNQSPVDWAHRAGECPQCGSTKTHRDYYNLVDEGPPKSKGEQLLDGCLAGCDVFLWPVFLALWLAACVAHSLSSKKRDCTCLDCGHAWKSLTPNKK